MPKTRTKTYKVNGIPYTVVEGKSGRENGNLYQYLTINGQEIKLYVTPTRDDYNSMGNGYNVALEIIPNEQNKRIDEFGRIWYEPKKGPDYLDLMGIFQAREKDKNVTWLERAAIFQQEYNKLAAAEYYAGVAENQHMKLAQNFLNTPQSPEELEKTLNEKFPWRDTTGMGDWCRANILGDKSAKRNRKKYSRCREEYDKLGKPRGNFNINGDRPGFEGKVYDAFCPYMSQNDTQTPVDENININNIEEDHERFMARVDKRAEQAATQTQEKPKPTRRRVSRTPNPRDDGYGMA